MKITFLLSIVYLACISCAPARIGHIEHDSSGRLESRQRIEVVRTSARLQARAPPPDRVKFKGKPLPALAPLHQKTSLELDFYEDSFGGAIGEAFSRWKKLHPLAPLKFPKALESKDEDPEMKKYIEDSLNQERDWLQSRKPPR